ncbi:hypothetical protein K402DRAFT_453869 [Aulographum hederae CBS 113979]|uniref:Uncharacterized protein n=1 Tax=Aulographum hederae CBS 113979 TaxID=1176131 RepID=A0A6G1H1Q8_9PEZI|nr:hypothetical protein K402DRAFT_453869 [Aulographum hederae CBS 113979]
MESCRYEECPHEEESIESPVNSFTPTSLPPESSLPPPSATEAPCSSPNPFKRFPRVCPSIAHSEYSYKPPFKYFPDVAPSVTYSEPTSANPFKRFPNLAPSVTDLDHSSTNPFKRFPDPDYGNLDPTPAHLCSRWSATTLSTHASTITPSTCAPIDVPAPFVDHPPTHGREFGLGTHPSELTNVRVPKPSRYVATRHTCHYRHLPFDHDPDLDAGAGALGHVQYAGFHFEDPDAISVRRPASRGPSLVSVEDPVTVERERWWRGRKKGGERRKLRRRWRHRDATKKTREVWERYRRDRNQCVLASVAAVAILGSLIFGMAYLGTKDWNKNGGGW